MDFPTRSTAGAPSQREHTTRVWLLVGGVSAATLLVLTVLVALGGTQGWDDAAREAFRPGDVWGTTQQRVDHLVEGLDPRTVLVLLVLTGALVSIVRRSIRPALLALGASALTVVATTVLQIAVQRPDTHGETPGLGGSFPSGHVTTLVVCAGTLVLLLRLDGRRWPWVVVAVAGAAMGTAMLLQAAHWASDVLGGALLGTVVLAAAALLARALVPASDQSPTTVESTS
ncbi:phosphatase PAP2 family protein [Mumia sp. zg.B21]|uniref:phosphatase PAP2 family protein n=1 Tax=Mumia sp. zg.B21 TaxID=2855447 RepID=UPI001C6F4FCF|nr:phosphatase PAP2 family protein [Mumia sp. zg.B21]MBW9210787.1 phosphatase PAP2 family protein [Mumia sp. zg.B21]